MKRSFTVFLLIIGGLAANVLVNTAAIAAWGLIDGEITRGVLAGTASIAVMCALAALVVKKSGIKRRTFLIFTQAPALAISLAAFVCSAFEYHRVMTSDLSYFMSGLDYALTSIGFEVTSVIFITAAVMTAALALTFGIVFYKEKRSVT